MHLPGDRERAPLIIRTPPPTRCFERAREHLRAIDMPVIVPRAAQLGAPPPTCRHRVKKAMRERVAARARVD